MVPILVEYTLNTIGNPPLKNTNFVEDVKYLFHVNCRLKVVVSNTAR